MQACTAVYLCSADIRLAPPPPWVQMIRVWDPASLEPVAGRDDMCHEASVRVLAAGPNSCLLSGCANGELAIWSL